jgi:hypothetical protein
VVHFLAPDETPLKQYQNTIKQMGYPGNPAANDVWELLQSPAGAFQAMALEGCGRHVQGGAGGCVKMLRIVGGMMWQNDGQLSLNVYRM